MTKREILGENGAFLDDNDNLVNAETVENAEKSETVETAEKAKTKETPATKRRISELKGDDYLDFIYAITPLLGILKDSKIIRAIFIPQSEKSIIQAAKSVSSGEMTLAQAQEESFIELLASDLPLILKTISAKNNRSAVYEVLALLDETTVEQVKNYTAKEITTKIASVLKTEEFKELFT